MTYNPIGAFIPALTDREEVVRQYGRRLLGMDDGADVPAFLTELLSDESDRIRLAAAVALGKLGDPAATEVLVDTLDGVDNPTD